MQAGPRVSPPDFSGPADPSSCDDLAVVTEPDLLASVDATFEVTGRRFAAWPDPHPDRSPLDEEYSRVADPGKWRIIGARAEAWLVALVEVGLATVERDAAVQWTETPGTVVTRSDRLVPRPIDAVCLVVARSRIADVDDAGVTLGVGDPAVCIAWIPECGCDACDSGSQSELDQLDAQILAVVSGRFRRLSAGDRVITALGDGSWSASGLATRPDVQAILADPHGWHELSGASWLAEP
jgi:Family of unknown function (DUF6226)